MKNSNKRWSQHDAAKRKDEYRLLQSIDESLKNQQTSFEPLVKDIVLKRLPANLVYPFEFTTNVSPNVTSSTTLESDYTFFFQLNNVLNVSSLTTIFDAYRIVGVRFKFIPLTGTQGAPLYTVIDYDDATTTTIATMQNYDTLKISPPGGVFERCFVPRVAVGVYGSSVFTNFGQAQDMWINSASPSVQHYGLKAGLPLSATPTTWAVSYTLKIQFKNVK
jgi:hypothetical protein